MMYKHRKMQLAPPIQRSSIQKLLSIMAITSPRRRVAAITPRRRQHDRQATAHAHAEDAFVPTPNIITNC
jgi:hypothetical protein